MSCKSFSCDASHRWACLQCVVSESFSEQCERLTRVQKGRFQVKYRAQGEGWHSTASRPLLQHHPEILSAATYSLPWEKNRSAAEPNICGSVSTAKMWTVRSRHYGVRSALLSQFVCFVVCDSWKWWSAVVAVIKQLFWILAQRGRTQCRSEYYLRPRIFCRQPVSILCQRLWLFMYCWPQYGILHEILL